MEVLDLSGWGFGEGAFIEDGAPVPVKFVNCEGTMWLRAIDGNMVADLAKDGVNLAELLKQDEDGKENSEAELRDNALEIIVANREKYQKVVKRVLVRFDGFKRVDGTPIPFDENMLDKIAGYPIMVLAIVAGGFSVGQSIAENSDSSSDGSDTPTVHPDGEPTPETTENVV